MFFQLLPAINTHARLSNLIVHEGMYMMLLATVCCSTDSHLVGVVGPYKQPYRKTVVLNCTTYALGHFFH